MAGRRGTNIRQGDLAEGLALELLRRFSAVAPVPRPDDVGLDAVCTLLRPDGDVVHAENSFGVQVKASSVREIVYDGREHRWFDALTMPAFLASLNLKDARIDLYSLLNAGLAPSDTPIGLVLCLDRSCAPGRSPVEPTARGHEVSVGPPVLSFSIADAAAPGFPTNAYETLKRHLIFAERGLRWRALGVRIGANWTTQDGPTLASYVTAGSGADVRFLFEELNPLLWRLRTLLGHLDSSDRLLYGEIRSIRATLKVNGIEPIGEMPDPHEAKG